MVERERRYLLATLPQGITSTKEIADRYACTSVYLNDEEWMLLSQLPVRTLRKKRHVVETDEWRVAIDELEDGTLLAEIDDGDEPSGLVPEWLDVVRSVSQDEAWTGGELAGQHRQPHAGPADLHLFEEHHESIYSDNESHRSTEPDLSPC